MKETSTTPRGLHSAAATKHVTRCTKTYTDYPAAHRVYNHTGHCKYIHGHNWGFSFEFEGPVDDKGFVVDFGSLKWLREHLERKFDHTCLIAADDPLLPTFAAMACLDLRVVKSPSSEGIAQSLYEFVTDEMQQRKYTAKLVSVTVFEDSRNSAEYLGL